MAARTILIAALLLTIACSGLGVDTPSAPISVCFLDGGVSSCGMIRCRVDAGQHPCGFDSGSSALVVETACLRSTAGAGRACDAGSDCPAHCCACGSSTLSAALCAGGACADADSACAYVLASDPSLCR